MAIPYINGFTIRPYEISPTGIVTFTNDVVVVTDPVGDTITEFDDRAVADGATFEAEECLTATLIPMAGASTSTRTLVQPNQQQCEAYGYTYNQATGTCTAFNYNTNLEPSLSNESNKIQGAGNSTETGTNNTTITGENNTVKGVSRNNIIVGSNNEIANGINNASVFGNYGIALRDGETVLGGGGFNGLGKGYAQSCTFLLTGTTTDAAATSLFVNGDPNTTIIARDVDSYIAYKFEIIAVRTGGTHAGSVGDRAFLELHGITDRTVNDEHIETVNKTGTITGWTAEVVLTAGDMTLQVQGNATMDVSWSVTANFYEIKI